MMSKANIHVVPHEGKWAIKREGEKTPLEIHDTQKKAAKRGREIAKADKVELLIHGRDGRIRERSSFGNDPYPPGG